MEFCFYFEKYWSGQNLTNQIVCYGFAINAQLIDGVIVFDK